MGTPWGEEEEERRKKVSVYTNPILWRLKPLNHGTGWVQICKPIFGWIELMAINHNGFPLIFHNLLTIMYTMSVILLLFLFQTCYYFRLFCMFLELRYIPCCLPSSIVAPSKVTDVFSFEFEKRPLQLEADFAVRMNVQPVEMVYDEVCIFTCCNRQELSPSPTWNDYLIHLPSSYIPLVCLINLHILRGFAKLKKFQNKLG